MKNLTPNWESFVGLAAILFFVLSAQGQDRVFAPVGGPGGGRFEARCPAGQMLGGVELRTGDDVDAIRPLCVSAYAPHNADTPTATGDWYGGSGGGKIVRLVCPNSGGVRQPIVGGMGVWAEGVDTVIVNRIALFCRLASTDLWRLREADDPQVLFIQNFEAPRYEVSHNGPFETLPTTTKGESHCPDSLLAVGINGRSGIWLDAVGVICGPLILTSPPAVPVPPPTVKGVGRTRGSKSPDSPPQSICELSREARARNSPAAPGLEAQCRRAGAAGEMTPIKAVGRTKDASSTNASIISICDAARNARARNSPAATGLEEKCRSAGENLPAIGITELSDLAAKGEAIANEDPLTIELRSRQPEGPTRTGFDVGMTAAQGQTQPGPRKDKIRAALNPAEQIGFDIAVTFSLERNSSADLASKGAAIAQADPYVAEARTSDQDVFYWLGFDIATGIFGDPALGARGNTALGPGSLKIRDSLSEAGQRGFNAAVKFHLSRNYRP